MLIILSATILSGVLFSKILLVLDVTDFRARYPLSVLVSYIVFFICVRLWLCCISPNKSNGVAALDHVDASLPSGSGADGGGLPSFRGGGGQFSGAGASTSFEGGEATVADAELASTSPPLETSSVSDGIGDAVADAAGALGDDNIIVAVIVLVVLLATILFSAAYVVYGAPAILSEAAFECFLAVSLIKKTREMGHESWAGSIFRATWKSFALTVLVAFFSGVFLHHYFPKAIRLGDILWNG
jgi:hypothetical protein